MRLLRRADESFYGAGTSLCPLGFSSILDDTSPYTPPFGLGATADGGQLVELLQAGGRRRSMPDLTLRGLGHSDERIRRRGQEVIKVPEDTPL